MIDSADMAETLNTWQSAQVHDLDHGLSDFLSSDRGLGAGQVPFGFERCEGAIKRLAGHADFRRDVLKLTFDCDGATVDAGTKPQILQDAIPRGADVAQFHPRPQFL